MTTRYMALPTLHTNDVMHDNEAVLHRLFAMGIRGLILENGNVSYAISAFYKHVLGAYSNRNSSNKVLPSNTTPDPVQALHFDENDSNFLDEALHQHGESLIDTILSGIANETADQFQVKELGNLLHRVHVHSPDACRQWMKQRESVKAMNRTNSTCPSCDGCATVMSDNYGTSPSMNSQDVIESFCSAKSKRERIRLIAGWCGHDYDVDSSSSDSSEDEDDIKEKGDTMTSFASFASFASEANNDCDGHRSTSPMDSPTGTFTFGSVPSIPSTTAPVHVEANHTTRTRGGLGLDFFHAFSMMN